MFGQCFVSKRSQFIWRPGKGFPPVLFRGNFFENEGSDGFLVRFRKLRKGGKSSVDKFRHGCRSSRESGFKYTVPGAVPQPVAGLV